jgi:hypothetical protein
MPPPFLQARNEADQPLCRRKTNQFTVPVYAGQSIVQRMHPNDTVDRLVAGCAEIAGHLDLFEGADVVMNQVGYLLRDGVLSHDAATYVFRVLNRLASAASPSSRTFSRCWSALRAVSR